MSDNYLVYKDQLHPNVKEMLSEDIGDVENLTTESKTVVGALNELVGKDIIAEKFGRPLSFTDSWSDMGNKIETVENKLRTNLVGKDVDVSGVADINGLVDKVNDIVIEQHKFPIWYKRPDIWISAVECPDSITNSGAVAIGDDVFVIGGEFTNKLFYKYNIVDNTWLKLTDIPSEMSFGLVAAIDGNIYILCSNNSHRCYNVKSKVWVSKANCPSGIRRDYSPCVAGTNIFHMGGYDSAYRKYNNMYDSVTDSWTDKASLLSSGGDIYPCEINNKIYVFGCGSNSKGDVESYDPINDTWTRLCPVTVNRYDMRSSAIGDKLYCVGGMTTVDEVVYTNSMYDVTTNTITEKERIPTKKTDFSMTNINNMLFIAGGSRDNNNATFLYIQE